MIEDIKNEYKNIKDTVSANNYIRNFRETFQVIDNKQVNANLLKELYFEFLIHYFKQTEVERFIINKIAEVAEDLMETLDDKQQKQIKIYDYLQRKLADDEGFNSFLWGYSLATELNMASNNYATNDKILNEIVQKCKLVNNKGGDVDNG